LGAHAPVFIESRKKSWRSEMMMDCVSFTQVGRNLLRQAGKTDQNGVKQRSETEYFFIFHVWRWEKQKAKC
jgi:hypothetical protein